MSIVSIGFAFTLLVAWVGSAFTFVSVSSIAFLPDNTFTLPLLLEAAQDSELVKSALLGHIQSKIDAQQPKTWMEKATVAETALDDFNIIESLVAPYVEKKNQQYQCFETK